MNNKKIVYVLISFLLIYFVIFQSTIKVEAAGTLDDFIERCYTVTLDRPSDTDGFNYWKGRVLNGEAVGIEVAYGFMFSPEYTKKDKTNTEYVTDLYTLFMGRDPDEGGFNDWMNKLDEGASRLDVFAGFANSPEFYNICDSYGITAGRYVKGYDRDTINNVNLYVERMYKICLDRIGDKDGQKNWVEQLITKQISGTECARRFIFSTEYTNKGLSDEEFVENLYLAMMGRPYDDVGKANWLNALACGKTRDEVFEGFANSIEFNDICKEYGINRGEYTATDRGNYTPNIIISTEDENSNKNRIYEGDGITIDVINLESKYNYAVDLGLLIENNSDSDFIIQTRDNAVNNYPIEGIFSPEVSKGETVQSEITYYCSDLEFIGVHSLEQINTIEFRFLVLKEDMDGVWRDYRESNIITISYKNGVLTKEDGPSIISRDYSIYFYDGWYDDSEYVESVMFLIDTNSSLYNYVINDDELYEKYIAYNKYKDELYGITDSSYSNSTSNNTGQKTVLKYSEDKGFYYDYNKGNSNSNNGRGRRVFTADRGWVYVY